MTEADASGVNKRRRVIRIAKRIVLSILAVIVLLALFVIVFAGPLAEYYIEKNDVEITGREVELNDLRVNLLSGKVEILGFTFYEENGQDFFFRADRVYAKLDPFKAFKNQILLSTADINRFELNISHDNQTFNFDDLLTRFASADDQNVKASVDTSSLPWNISVYNINVDSCRLNYINQTLDTRITADPFYLYSPLFSTLVDTFSVQTDLRFLKQGQILTDAIIDLGKENYAVDLDIIDVPIDYLYHYMKDYLDISEFSGVMNFDIQLNGSMTDVQQLAWSGRAGIDSLLIRDRAQDSLFGFERLWVEAKNIDHGSREYTVQEIVIDRPYLRFELFPEGDNFTELLMFDMEEADTTEAGYVQLPGREYFNVFVYIADFAQQMVETYVESDFRIDSAVLQNGRLIYVDHTLDETATFVFDDLSVATQMFDSHDDRVGFRMSSTINRAAKFKAKWDFNPKDALEMELQTETDGFLVVAVSPYTYYHTAHPFTSGAAIHRGQLSIHDRKLEGDNYFYVEQMQVGRKGFADPPIRLPVRLAVAILKDKDGNIEYELPIAGDLDDPKYRIGPAILTVLGNNLEKLIVAPYRLFANMFSVDEEDLKQVNWLYGQYEMDKAVEKQVSSLSKVLESKPDLNLTFTPLNNRQKEAEYLALFKAKQDYYIKYMKDSDEPLNQQDTLSIGAISSQDSLFIEHLHAITETQGLTSSIEMSMMAVGVDSAMALVRDRERAREEAFKNEFLTQHSLPTHRIQYAQPDSTAMAVDTFNLSGPIYLLGFAFPDSTQMIVKDTLSPPDIE